MDISYEIVAAQSLSSVSRFELLGIWLKRSQLPTKLDALDIHNNIQKRDSRTRIGYCLASLAKSEHIIRMNGTWFANQTCLGHWGLSSCSSSRYRKRNIKPWTGFLETSEPKIHPPIHAKEGSTHGRKARTSSSRPMTSWIFTSLTPYCLKMKLKRAYLHHH